MASDTNSFSNPEYVSSPRRGSPVSGTLAGVIAATATTLGSFGLVISGIWLVHSVVN